MKHLLVLPLITVLAFGQSPLRYDNFQVYRLIPQNIEQLQAIHQIQQTHNEFNFWTDITKVGKHIDIMVPPNSRDKFKDATNFHNLPTEIFIEDVQGLIDRENLLYAKSAETFDWHNYHTLDKIYEWMNSLPDLHPGKVSRILGGYSYEGRQIVGVKISFKPGNKGVFLEGGIHAREWIAPATVTYIANQLLTSNDSNVRAVAESRNWYVFPVFNPDGYVYTRTDRMWRKTRKPYGTCYGADPNRNWGYHWMYGGASTSPCSETFAGSSAFSEIETKSLSEYINTIADNLDAYLAFHSYSQLLLIPFGHAGYEVPPNNDELLRIGKNATKVLAKRYGTTYKVGNIPEAIYVASGGSSDWVLGTHRHIRLVYTYELRDVGNYGFILPPEQIIPTGEETLDSIVSIFQQADAS